MGKVISKRKVSFVSILNFSALSSYSRRNNTWGVLVSFFLDGQGVSSACSESHYRFWQQLSRCFVCTYECSAMWQSVFKTQGKLCEYLPSQCLEQPLQTKQYLGRACLLLLWAGMLCNCACSESALQILL